MRRFLIAAVFAASTLPAFSISASAAPMSTSDLLREPGTTQVWCKRVCKAWGYCGYGYNKYRCCKRWVCH